MLHKIKIIVFIMLLAVLIVGCEANQAKSSDTQKSSKAPNSEPAITIHSVTDEEERTTVRATGADTFFIFQFDIHDDSVQAVEYWVDYYQDGEFVESMMNGGSRIGDMNRPLKLYFTAHEIPQTEQEIWGVALRQGDGFGRSETMIDLEHIAQDAMEVVHPIMELTANTDETVSLGMIALNRGNSGSASNDVERTIQDNDYVYVLRCKFN